jgi:hypothetical protein
MPNYYYSTDGVNSVGPIDVNGLAALLRARTITRQTAAILEGQEAWATVGDYLPDTLRVGKPQEDRDDDHELIDDEIATKGRSKKAKKRQSPVIAFGLGFLFGPLGLIFVNWLAVVVWIGLFIIVCMITALVSPGTTHPGVFPFIMLGGGIIGYKLRR